MEDGDGPRTQCRVRHSWVILGTALVTIGVGVGPDLKLASRDSWRSCTIRVAACEAHRAAQAPFHRGEVPVRSMPRCKHPWSSILHVRQILDQLRPCRLPAQRFLRPLTGRRHIQAGEVRKPPEAHRDRIRCAEQGPRPTEEGFRRMRFRCMKRGCGRHWRRRAVPDARRTRP